MSEGNHSVPAQAKSSLKQKWALLVGGTAIAVLAAGIVFQIFRAEPVDAGAEPGPAAQAQPGAARVGAPANSQRRAIGTVNGQVIYQEMVAQECFNRIGREVLDNIINRMIIQQACEERGLTITDAEVDDEVSKIAQKFNLTPDNWYQMLQAERNLTPQQYRRDIIWPMIALKKLAGDTVTVSDEDMQKAFVREYGERVKARMIMLDNSRRATEVWEKAVANPEEFGALARKHSVDPTSRPLDGAIPPIRQYAGLDNLETAAFKLKPGELSGVIQVDVNRYVILLCEGRTERTVEFEEVQKDLHEQLIEEKVQESVAKVFEGLKNGARVDNYLTNTTTGEPRRAAATGAKGPVRTASGELPAAATRQPATGQRTR